ncbi:MAG TPA: TylF/MycF/NovP-related O-methyltransferase [Blastocatellia bacterium]|nr:TylF/MycF/NovP-related O-methyltransferase [Blastocatellia bacterium]
MKGREIYRRILDWSWLLSQAQDLTLHSWDSISRGEFARFYRLVRPYTMSSNARLRGLHRGVRHVVMNNTLGDVVECGAARGGSAALMGLTLNRLDARRTLWVFDTFEGLPPPTLDDPDFETAKLYTGTCRGELDEVEALFERLGILSNSKFVKGLFQETLPACTVEKIAVLHVDGDWYDSVRVCLDHLYDRVSPGGIIQIDDYGHWAGARKAVDEFLRQRDIDVALRRLDYTGRQFIKP